MPGAIPAHHMLRNQHIYRTLQSCPYYQCPGSFRHPTMKAEKQRRRMHSEVTDLIQTVVLHPRTGQNASETSFATHKHVPPAVSKDAAAAATGAECVHMKTENRILLSASGRISTAGRACSTQPARKCLLTLPFRPPDIRKTPVTSRRAIK